MATGMRDDVGAGLDIRVDACADSGDSDAHSRGVESGTAKAARHCTGRESMSMASTAAATVTLELVPGGAARGSDTHSSVAAESGADVPAIPEVVSEQSRAAIPRRHVRHTVVGVEVQDVFEDDTDVAETPRRMVDGSDVGHGRWRIVCGAKTHGATASMEKVVLTADETALIRYIGQKAAGPRHALRLPADHETVATVSRLAEKGLAESTGFVQRTGGNELFRACLTGKGWVKFRGLKGS